MPLRDHRDPAAGYRLQLALGTAAVVAVFAIAWTWSLAGPLHDTILAQQERRLTDVARGTAVTLAPLFTLDSPLAELADATSLRVTVVAADGTVIADSEESAGSLENHRDRPEVRAARRHPFRPSARRSETQGIERMYVAVPARWGDEPVALRVSEPLADINALTRNARRAGLIALVIALIIASFTAWRLTRRAAAPVEQLVDSACSMAKGDLGTRVPDVAGPPAPLAESLRTLRDGLHARIAAAEAEERTLRGVLDGLTDAVFLLDSDRIRMANRSLATMFHMSPGDPTGVPLSELGLPASLTAAISRQLENTTASTNELGPDPFARYHRVTVLPLTTGGVRTGTLVVIADVTARMRLDAVRRDFVANASHELKTPVAAIVLLSEAAEAAIRDGDDEQAAAFLGQVGDEATRLRRLVTDLLDLSRLESAPGAEEVTDVRRAIELALAGHQRAAATKQLALSADLSAVSGDDVAVRVGATDVAIALDNILSNAIAYTEHGSVVVRVTADDTTVKLAVTDTGIGIPPESIDRVFERFYRVDAARSRTKGGTGLGLSLVRNVAEAAGGSVSIASEVGSGTTVTLRLPRAR